jgi:hypothetical protein
MTESEAVVGKIVSASSILASEVFDKNFWLKDTSTLHHRHSPPPVHYGHPRYGVMIEAGNPDIGPPTRIGDKPCWICRSFLHPWKWFRMKKRE